MYHILTNKVRCEGTRQLQILTTGANINGQRLVTVNLQNQVKKSNKTIVFFDYICVKSIIRIMQRVEQTVKLLSVITKTYLKFWIRIKNHLRKVSNGSCIYHCLGQL